MKRIPCSIACALALTCVAHMQGMFTGVRDTMQLFFAGAHLSAISTLPFLGSRQYSKQSDVHHKKILNINAAVAILSRKLTNLRRHNDFHRGRSPHEDSGFIQHGLLNIEDFAQSLADTKLAYANVCQLIECRYKSDSRLFVNQLNKQLQAIHVKQNHVLKELDIASSILEHYRLVHGQNVLMGEIGAVKKNQSRILNELQRVQEKLSNTSEQSSQTSEHVMPPLPSQIQALIERVTSPRGK